MSKRDAFWDSVYETDGTSIAWPDSETARGTLASRIVGARLVGALENVLSNAIVASAGTLPAPGTPDFPARSRDAHVLASLSAEQRDAVQRLLKRTSYFSLYWPLVSLDNLPGATLDVSVLPTRGDETLQPCCLTEYFGLHAQLHAWMKEFAEIVDQPDVAPAG